MKCELCEKKIKYNNGFLRLFVIRTQKIFSLKSHYYHKKCFNKQFIIRDVPRKQCVCKKETSQISSSDKIKVTVGYLSSVSHAFNSLVSHNYHKKCFNKYWMPYHLKRHKSKKPIIKSKPLTSVGRTWYTTTYTPISSYYYQDTGTGGGGWGTSTYRIM